MSLLTVTRAVVRKDVNLDNTQTVCWNRFMSSCHSGCHRSHFCNHSALRPCALGRLDKLITRPMSITGPAVVLNYRRSVKRKTARKLIITLAFSRLPCHQ